MTAKHESLSIDALRSAVRGRVISGDDSDYDARRQVMYPPADDLRPLALVRAADAADVRAVIGIARETGLGLAVRSGGHSGAGHGTTDGGLVLDLRDLRAIEIDVADRSVWAGAGLTAGELSAAVTKHDLVIGFGDTGSVGIGGITLGGGVGYLARRHGLTIDSLLAAEVVTADGRIRHVDATTDPDLFWGIRGGGGNLGVVTKFRYRLHPLPHFVGGMLVLPATAETVAGFIAAADAAPDELSTIANVMPAPPMPFLPESVHGKLVILGMLAFAGDPTAGERVLAPFRALATPHADMVRPMRYVEMFPPDDPDYRPTAVARTMYIDRVDHDVAATILEFLRASNAPMRVAQLRVLGGAASRVPADATAYAHRSSRIMVNLAALHDGPTDARQKAAWVAEFRAALHQGDVGAYVNFVGDEGDAGVRAAYPGATWDRLAAIKAIHDPQNLFHRNQNVPPEAAV